jgi:hypothetical protein
MEIERLRADEAEMIVVLRWLVDLQNGPPLPKYAADWQRTMDRARAILDAKEPKP